jgi:hypothetical protein
MRTAGFITRYLFKRGSTISFPSDLCALSVPTRHGPRDGPGLPWTHRAEVVADDDAQQEGQPPGPRVVHCLAPVG